MSQLKWFHFLAPLVVASAFLLHCASDDPLAGTPYGGTGGKGGGVGFGEPCKDGESRDCNAVVGKHEGYVDCFEGVQTCVEGKWGPCMGSTSGGKVSSKRIAPESPWWSVQDFSGEPPPNVPTFGGPSAGPGSQIKALSDASVSGQPCTVNVCNPYCVGYDETPPAPVGIPPFCQTDGGSSVDGGADAGGDAGCTTTVSGTVYDPAGSLPLPNIMVFQPAGALTVFTDNGATAQCDTCASLATPAYATVVSNVDGTFTLPIDTTLGTTNIKVVFQSGRWRRQIILPSVTACQNNPIANGNARLPRNKTEGDIPKIAIAMANQESLECLLVKMGVSTTEFKAYQGPGDTNRIQLFRNNSGIATNTAPTPPLMMGAAGRLLDTPALLNSYSAVLFACGAGGDITLGGGTAAQRANVRAYGDAGGKLFINHVPGSMMIKSQLAATQWPATATMGVVGANDPPCGAPGCQRGRLLSAGAGPLQMSQWMALPTVGGTLTYGAPLFKVDVPKNFATAVNPATAIEWTRGANNGNWVANPTGNYTLSYSFETPPAAANKCGRVVFTDMHVHPTRGNQGMGFPAACNNGPLAEDEKALAYMLFVTTACAVGVPPVPTPVPSPTPPQPTNYNNTYSGSCPPGTKPKWTSFSYNVNTPPGTEIKFAVQTSPDGGAGTWTPATGTPAGVMVADVPLDHPGGNAGGVPSCTTTGPSPCGNNCAASIGAPMTSACPASCSCPIDLSQSLTTAQQLPFLQMNATLIPTTGGCAGALSPGLLTVGNNGVTTCPGAQDIQGTACTAATKYTACNQDHHCDLDPASPTFQTCVYNNGPSPWIDPNCVAGGYLGFDLTIEPACSTNGGASYNVPVCNRGGATIPAGQTIVITRTNFAASCAKACAGPGAANCSYVLPSPLGPGACINIPPAAGCNMGAGNACLQVNPGNTVVDVNGNKECNSGVAAAAATWVPANGVGAGCLNNDTYIKATPFCMTCANPLQPPAAPSMSSWTVAFSCAPEE